MKKAWKHSGNNLESNTLSINTLLWKYRQQSYKISILYFAFSKIKHAIATFLLLVICNPFKSVLFYSLYID